MTVLVTGATGQTGREVARLLGARGVPFRAASRGTGFDWTDPATFESALDGVDAVYLLPPPGGRNRMALLEPFLAAAKGVRRLVLLSTSVDEVPGQDEFHQAVVDAAPEYAILRPSWFMQNFVGAHPTARGITERGEVMSATGEGRLGFVHADDIAAVAVETLLAGEAPNRDYVLTGPESLSYRDVAALIDEVAGYPVRYVPLTPEQGKARWASFGLPEEAAQFAIDLDLKLAAGLEDRVTTTVPELTGRPARSFHEFVAAQRSNWQEKTT
ncbi:MAG TPA: NAD-dependent epimerase/dehydratase family protein [Pseudonocardiaceae bacterium]